MIQSNGLKIKLKKCDFGLQKVSLLAHIIYGKGVHMDPENVSEIKRRLWWQTEHRFE